MRGREQQSFEKFLRKLARRNNFKTVNMGADSNVVCTLVASFSVTREENSSRQFSVSVINFLADKNNKAWATLGISNSEHHREQLSILSGNLSQFSGIFF